jgi:cytochrome b6-f complex iron-sulfur subunit
MTALLALSSSKIAALVAVGVMVLFMALLVSSFIRTRRTIAATVMAEEGQAPPTAPKEPAAPRKPPPAVTRREFFRRSLVGSLLVFGAEFGGASLAFLWPNLKGGFGSVIAAGKVTDIQNQIQQTNQPFYNGPGRFYVVSYNGTGSDPATGVDYYADGYLLKGLGLMALYQRCVHLGCRVPFCQQSQWFECPCHGSKYNKAGEYQLGPAPTGLQRFKLLLSGEDLMVDTSDVTTPGPPRGTDTIHEPPQGPFCVAPG